MSMTRKEFFGTMIKYAAGIVGLATVTAASGCGSDPAPADAPGSVGNCLANGTTVTIAANHGHVMMVTKAEVMAAADKTYDIMGTAAHTHSVTVTAANFGTLAGNHAINVTSTVGGGHTHDVTVVCA
jgi:hypothetical protein